MFVAATLGLLLLWGLFAPRSSWRVLTGWSVSDPHGNEPGAASYGIRRAVAGAGTIAMAGIVVVATSSYVANLPKPVPPPSPIQVMWGSPDPQVVNRVVNPLPAAPAGLVEIPILGYQAFPASGPPSYLTRLKQFSRLGVTAIPGYIGRDPDATLAAIDTASMVIHVRGPILCIPRQAVVIETQSTVQIGIFYGLPDAADGAAVDSVAGCPADSTLTGSLLIPITLGAPLGDREVQSLTGQPLESVSVVSSGD